MCQTPNLLLLSLYHLTCFKSFSETSEPTPKRADEQFTEIEELTLGGDHSISRWGGGLEDPVTKNYLFHI